MLKPYYSDDFCEIYHGKCENILPQMAGGFDLLLTDPPYGIGEAAGKNKSRGCMAVSKDYGNDDWDDQPCSPSTIALIRAAARYQIIFGGNYYSLPPSAGWIVWDKDNGATDFADCELAWTNLPMAARLFKWRWQGMLQERAGRHKETRVHPTQKPVALMKWCISKAPVESPHIIDPFMGSGTTLRAAKDDGCFAVGIEKSEHYCEIAAKRLEQGVLF